MRILANAVFERIVYNCSLVHASHPDHPTLVVDAMLRPGDADGPLLIAIADIKRMIGFEAAAAMLPSFRQRGRTELLDGVEYLTFPIWERIEP